MNKFTNLLALVALALPLSLSAQIIKDYIRNDWPDSRYQVHGDGTVTDTVTGLMWMQCSLGQDPAADCNGSASYYDWEQALEEADGYTFANYSDWRLPNIKELSSLAARDRYSPAINSTVFPNTKSSLYWSTSPDASGGEYAWQLYFNDGDDYGSARDYVYYVRLVRAGK